LDFSNLTFGALMAGMVVSSIGVGLFIYGKRQNRVPHLIAGMVLLVLPFLVRGTLAMSGASAGAIALLWLGVRAGY
jgi:hypothetical protein